MRKRINPNGKKAISNQFKVSGEIESEKVINEDIKTEMLTAEELGSVSVGGSETHNLGNYESIKIDIHVMLPTRTDDKSIIKTKEKCAELVDKFLSEEREAAGIKR